MIVLHGDNIKTFRLVERQVEMIKNITFSISDNDFLFQRMDGRFLFSTKDIYVAYGYAIGVAHERAAIS